HHVFEAVCFRGKSFGEETIRAGVDDEMNAASLCDFANGLDAFHLFGDGAEIPTVVPTVFEVNADGARVEQSRDVFLQTSDRVRVPRFKVRADGKIHAADDPPDDVEHCVQFELLPVA